MDLDRGTFRRILQDGNTEHFFQQFGYIFHNFVEKNNLIFIIFIEMLYVCTENFKYSTNVSLFYHRAVTRRQ